MDDPENKPNVSSLSALSQTQRAALNRLRASLFADHDFLPAYIKWTDELVLLNPEHAVGGKWDEIGGLQFSHLCEYGLKPHHKLLDIGCGTLRGGRHFIRYLNAENYFGFDISPKAIEYANHLVEEEDLTKKRPKLRAIVEDPLQFEQFDSLKFDFLLAQSVFTHLPQDMIEECFAHIGNLMHIKSCFFFTYKNSEQHMQVNANGFRHPFRFFRELAERHGFRIKMQPEYEKNHPRNQSMAVVRLS